MIDTQISRQSATRDLISAMNENASTKMDGRIIGRANALGRLKSSLFVTWSLLNITHKIKRLLSSHLKANDFSNLLRAE